MIYSLLASGVASTGDAVQLFLIGPVIFVLLIFLVRLGIGIAHVIGGLWNHIRPHQAQPPSVPPTEAMATEPHLEPPDHGSVNLLCLPQTEPPS
jgi:hypothetical protein